jgi:signal peptide peptidase SppA
MNKINMRQIYNTPLLIKGAYFNQLQAAYGKDYISDMLGIDEKDSKPKMEVVDGIAVIPVDGCIAYNVLPYEKVFFGLTDLLDIEQLLNEALTRSDIEGVIMSYNTAGGFVTYVDEMANKIAKARSVKPIFSYVPTMSCSAGYYLACSSHAIYSNKTGEVGSIGVYMSRFDVSKMYADKGVKLDLIKHGDFKATWHEGKVMTPQEEEQLQRGVDYLYSLFATHVKNMSGNIKDEYLQGQCFFGGEAINLGLVDTVVSGIDEVIADIKAYRTLGG